MELSQISTPRKAMTKADIKDISCAANKAEEMKSVFPLTNRACRLVLTAPVTVAKMRELLVSKNCQKPVQIKNQRRKVRRTYVHDLRKGYHRRDARTQSRNTVGFFKIKANCHLYKVTELSHHDLLKF